MSDFVVATRQAGGADSIGIQKLYVELTGDCQVHVLPEQIETILGSPNTRLLVCEIGGEVCATALVFLCPDAMYGRQPFAVVENIIVANNVRRRGIGRHLMESIEFFCQENDCSKVMLLSSSSRTEAHAFFSENGFSGDQKKGFVKYRNQFRTHAL
jgi:N-acetylglutamate synthase-like GNAT family acetyltransferase